MARLRSPNYPSLSLAEAITKVKQIYEKEFTNQATREVMIKAMGYSGINGASAVVFSALTKYGLIASIGNDQYKISEDALNILLYQKGDPIRFEAIERAAISPSLFGELKEQYPNVIPSDDNLTAYLVKRGFNPKSVNDIIQSYRETIELLSSERVVTESSHVTNQADSRPTETSHSSPPPVKASEVPLDSSVLSFKISRDSDVQIRFSGSVTQEAIEKLISLLTLSKDVYPTVKELESEIQPPVT